MKAKVAPTYTHAHARTDEGKGPTQKQHQILHRKYKVCTLRPVALLYAKPSHASRSERGQRPCACRNSTLDSNSPRPLNIQAASAPSSSCVSTTASLTNPHFWLRLASSCAPTSGPTLRYTPYVQCSNNRDPGPCPSVVGAGEFLASSVVCMGVIY